MCVYVDGAKLFELELESDEGTASERDTRVLQDSQAGRGSCVEYLVDKAQSYRKVFQLNPK